MKTTYKPWLLSSLAAALVLVAGCSNNSDDNAGGNPGLITAGTVPDSAGASVASFMAFLMSLSSSDETSEPLLIKDSFAVPVDEAGDGQALS